MLGNSAEYGIPHVREFRGMLNSVFMLRNSVFLRNSVKKTEFRIFMEIRNMRNSVKIKNEDERVSLNNAARCYIY